MKIHAYLRKSTENHQEHSLETQRKRIGDFCNYKFPDIEVVYYTDIMSGTKDQRPEYQKMLSEIKNNDLLVVYSLSRLSRSVKHCLEVIDELEKKNVKLISLNENIDLTNSNPYARFQLTMLSSLAELEVSVLRSRIKDAMSRLASEGKLKKKPKYGFKFNGRGNAHIQDEEEQRIIQKIKNLYVEEGLHISGIAEKLNKEGVKLRKAKKIYPNIVKKILIQEKVMTEE